MKTDWLDPKNHQVLRLWPKNHSEFKLAERNPIVKCNCGWKYEVPLNELKPDYTGVDCVNELLDAFNRHLTSVKNKWGRFDKESQVDAK